MFTFIKFLKMQSIFVFPGNVYLLLMLLLFAALCTTTLSDKIDEKTNGILKDNSNVDINSIVSDLQNGKRVVFAVGPVDSKMTFFISGPGGKTDVVSGCTVQVEENNNGIFKITNPPSKMPNGVSSAEVIFVCVDSSGSNVVTMSENSVFAANLPDGKAVPVKIHPSFFPACFYDGVTHISSSTPLYYYTINSSEVRHRYFSGKTILSSDVCNPKGLIKYLCINNNKIVIKENCQGSVIPNLVSGYVSDTTAYLFDTANTVYVFDASVFTSEQSVDLKKVSSKEAWKGSTSVQPSSKPEPEPKVKTTSANNKSVIIFVMLGILVLLLIFLCIFVYCCFFRGGGSKKNSKKKGKRAVSGKKNKSKKSSKKTVGSKKKSNISKNSRFASKKTFSTSKSGKKGSKSSKGSKSLKGKSSKSSKSSKVKSSKIKNSKGKGSIARGRRSSTKVQKKSVSQKTTALSGR